MWRARFQVLSLGCFAVAVAPEVAAQNGAGSGGGGRGEGCIRLSMPCQFGPRSDATCEARSRAARPSAAIPAGDCVLQSVVSPGLAGEARDWLTERLRGEVLPAVCSCYREGLGVNPRLRGRVRVRVRMREGCALVEDGGESTLADRFTLDCIRGRFIGFAAAPPSLTFPPERSPFAAQLADRRFVVELELRPQPSPGKPPPAPTRPANAPPGPPPAAQSDPLSR